MKRLIVLFLVFAAFGCAQQTNHSVTLTWSWSQGTGALATGFQVYRAPATSGTTCPTAPATVTTPAPFAVIDTANQIANLTYVDQETAANQLTEGATYCYAVVMTDAGGSSVFSNVAGATIPFSVPNSPTSLSAVAK